MDELRLGIAGLGTVGSGVVRLVQQQADLLAARAGMPVRITSVSAHSRTKNRSVKLDGYSWAEHPLELAKDKSVDAVVELIGGAEGMALELCRLALKNGKHVITANKAMIAQHGHELAKLAEKHQVALRFEAAVAGAIPILSVLREGLAANRISRVAGILNGTCNFMLTSMEKSGQPFEVILREAQDLGFAEADPSFDIDGIDSAHKLAILASLAFGAQVDFDHVEVEGIRRITPQDIDYAKSLGFHIKLLGIAEWIEDRLSQRVHPFLVGTNQPMGKVSAEYNAVEVLSHAAGPMFIEGRGAGGDATASAVMADVVAIARGHHLYPFGLPADKLATPAIFPAADRVASCYIRFRVVDRPGVLAAISDVFYRHNVSVKACIQHSYKPAEPVDVVIVVHPVREGSLSQALTRIGQLDFCLDEPLMLRIADL
ncbi:homoserine dehydrogenase [bacterium]|nr:homoserine dehydrogenase [bacterium]